MQVETRVVQVSSLGSKKLTKLNAEGWRVISSSQGILGAIDVILERPRGFVPAPTTVDIRKQERRQQRNAKWSDRMQRFEAAAQAAEVERKAERDARRTRRSEEKATRAAAREAEQAAAAASALPPAAWSADPFGRHEMRYWNGRCWTGHVSDAGTLSSDPIPPH